VRRHQTVRPATHRKARYVVPFSPIVLGGALGVPCTRKPLQAGPNPCPRVTAIRVSTEHAALKAGSCAAGLREPGQVRKEAALSAQPRVPQERLAGAGDPASAG